MATTKTAEVGSAQEPEAILPVVNTAEVGARRDSLLDRMKAHYAQAKRVPVKIRGDQDAFVQINGYSFHIQKGVRVEVPEDLVPVLDEAGYL